MLHRLCSREGREREKNESRLTQTAKSDEERERERERGGTLNTLDTVCPSPSRCTTISESALLLVMRVSSGRPVKREEKRKKRRKARIKASDREGERENEKETAAKLTKSARVQMHQCNLTCVHCLSLTLFLWFLQTYIPSNPWTHCDPISFQGKKKKSYSHASASISHSSSSSSLTSKLSKCGAFLTSAACVKQGQRDRTGELDPITVELEKRRRRRCLILSTLFTLAIILGIFLVTSFVMFVISSYQSYYGTSSPGGVVVTQPQSDTASLSVTGMSVNAAVVPTSSLPFFTESNSTARKSAPHWIESTAAANYDNSLASITPPATSVLVTHHTLHSPPRSSNSTRQQQQQQQQQQQPQQTVAPSTAGGRTGDEEDEEPACLEGEEWKCADGLCIPREKRCDGHFNCYDHSDEANCNPCPLSEGYFHCGNETSCLDPSKRCNGVFDCWDGSDEHLCIPGCDTETEFTCSPSGRCIEKGQFCDGVPDCEDDEPVGCSTLAPGPKVII